MILFGVVIHFYLTNVTTIATSWPLVIVSSIKKADNLITINRLRGGALYYEHNPNHPQHSPTLGDVDKDGTYTRATFQSPLHQRQRSMQPITETISNYITALHQFSPTLCYGLFSSILVFILWQFPVSSFVSKNLQNHFQCSRYNVIQQKRLHALILSAFSHASFHHIAVNMIAYLTFGRSVKQELARNGMPLWPFVFVSAIIGNIFFLIFDNGSGSCIGLSGVTLSLLAFDALLNPATELRMFVSFIPLTIQAYNLYLILLSVSVLGTAGIEISDRGIAHSTHLGGLICGTAVYEAYTRGWLTRLRKAYLALRES